MRKVVTIKEIKNLEAETAVVASLIHHPEYYYYAEYLLPEHFTSRESRLIYEAVSLFCRQNNSQKNIINSAGMDALLITELLKSNESTYKSADLLDLNALQEFIELSDTVSRHSAEEYKLLADNVVNAAFRRKTCRKLQECITYCEDMSNENIQEIVYSTIDETMTEFSHNDDIPQMKEVVDDYWDIIKRRQSSEYAAIPFKFPTLNTYAAIEPGELFVFAADAKQGKSMMLLNCAIDLMRKRKRVLYLDSELNSRLFTARVLAHLSKIEYRRLISGNYTPEEAERIPKCIDWVKQHSLTHCYIPTFDLNTIYTTFKKVYHTQGVDVLIIDYFKGSGDGDAFNSYQELGKFTDFVKNKICGEMNVAGLAAAQATSTGKVADSAKIGRNASVIALITEKEPEEIERDGIECGNKKLRIVLNRNGEQMLSDDYIDLAFNGNLISYEEAVQHTNHEPY